MKKFFTVLFVIFGIIFLIELIGIAYLYFADPFGINSFIFSASDSNTESTTNNNTATSTNSNPLLNTQQEDILRSAGINPADLPTNITPETEDCLYNAVGKDRAVEIMNGATPTLSEILKGKNCLN